MKRWVYRRPWMYEKQSAAFFNDARYSWIEGSTKSGKTVASIAWLFEQTLAGQPGYNYLWIAPIYAQAKIAYRRFKRGLPPALWSANDSELRLELLNGTTIWFKGGDNPDSIYGEDYHAAVIDEASRCKDDVWTAVRSTLTATQGPVRAIGNVRGRGNFHYRMCRTAEAGAPNMLYFKITALDAVAGGILPQAEIDDARRQLPEHVFRELYLAEPSDDGGNPFGLDHIRACVAPLSEDRPAAIGVDLAKSVDWTVMVGLDRQARTCGFDRWQHTPWDETERRILDLGGHVPMLIDSTGVGDPIVERLQKKRTGIEGFKFTAQSKQRLMEGLAAAIQSRQVSFPDGPIRAELEMFEYQYHRHGVRYAAAEGAHDDCVMALALAVEKHRQVVPRLSAVAPAGGTMISPWLGATSG